MSERTAADAALRQRITALSVHVRCEHARGPLVVEDLSGWQHTS